MRGVTVPFAVKRAGTRAQSRLPSLIDGSAANDARLRREGGKMGGEEFPVFAAGGEVFKNELRRGDCDAAAGLIEPRRAEASGEPFCAAAMRNS